MNRTSCWLKVLLVLFLILLLMKRRQSCCAPHQAPPRGKSCPITLPLPSNQPFLLNPSMVCRGRDDNSFSIQRHRGDNDESVWPFKEWLQSFRKLACSQEGFLKLQQQVWAASIASKPTMHLGDLLGSSLFWKLKCFPILNNAIFRQCLKKSKDRAEVA